MNEPKYDSVIKELYAKALGDCIMSCIKDITPEEMRFYMQLNSIITLAQIKIILDNEELDDPSCFHRIDAIVDEFHKSGISTSRHDF